VLAALLTTFVLVRHLGCAPSAAAQPETISQEYAVKSANRVFPNAQWIATEDLIVELKARFPAMLFIGFTEDPNTGGQPTVVLYSGKSLVDSLALANWATMHLTGASVGKMITNAADKRRRATS
jgi:hypothetical protein